MTGTHEELPGHGRGRRAWAGQLGPVAETAPLLVALALLVVLVPPRGEFPTIDDWDYAATARELAGTGRLHLSDWPAMTLVAQAAWGALAIKLAGPSYAVLRGSVLVLLAAGALALHAWCRWHGRTRLEAQFAALAFAFCPLAVALSYTFMTDVPAVALMLIWLAALPPCGRRGDAASMALLGLLGAAGYLVRQTSALPAAVFGGMLLLDLLRGRVGARKVAAFALAAGLPVLAYQAWLHAVAGVPYEATLAKLDLANLVRPKVLVAKLVVTAISLGFYLSPAILGARWGPLRRPSRRDLPGLAGLAALAACWLGLGLLGGDVLRAYEGYEVFDFGLGGMTTRVGEESLWGPALRVGGARVSLFRLATTALGIATVTRVVFVVFAAAMAARRPGARAWPSTTSPEAPSQVVWASFAASIGLLVVARTVFDRYYLPTVALGLAGLASRPHREGRAGPSWTSWAIWAALAAFGVAGTEDNLARRAAAWQAAERLERQGVPHAAIQAGLEHAGVYRFTPTYRGPIRVSRPRLARMPPDERDAELARFAFRGGELPYLVAWGPLPGHEVIFTEPCRSSLRVVRVYALHRVAGSRTVGLRPPDRRD